MPKSFKSGSFSLLTIAAIAAMMVACVPAKRYHEAERSISFYRDKSDECKVEVDLLKKKVKQLESDIAQLEADKHALEQDTTLYGMKNRTLLSQLATLENDLKALAAKNGDMPEYKALMKHLLQMQDNLVDSEDKRLDTERAIELQKKALADAENALAESEENLARSAQQLVDKDIELNDKAEQIQQQNAALANARNEIEEQAARLRELEAALAAKDHAMAELRNTIANALTDFSSEDLTVSHKDGRVYVSLEEQLLFESGKYDVNAKGQTAIKKIASVLASHHELDIVVEGHTDNVPYHGQVILDNWDLSVKRATSVLRIILANGSVDAAHIQATGRADTCPVDKANTPEARKKNRRTEIILAPNMDQVIGILSTK
ncbi:MAG: OmpA family protein [Bacteroidales bacterium]|nr:OmpA family protein [Bacteroidales bacterium]